jgi:hypothetical protein
MRPGASRTGITTLLCAFGQHACKAIRALQKLDHAVARIGRAGLPRLGIVKQPPKSHFAGGRRGFDPSVRAAWLSPS